MMQKTKTLTSVWLFFTFSDKLKFAIKASISLMLAYIIPLALGWNQPNISAITVMFIAASTTGVKDSFAKGVVRILGTLLGAFAGLLLVSLFPQERLEYLIALAFVLALFAYLYYAYEGDKTVFMLGSVMTMMIFVSGAENAFLYGIERTYMTVFGIVVYTLVSVFLWPNYDAEESSWLPKTLFAFSWWESEHLKGVVQQFVIYTFSVLFWIYFNPPGGFIVVVFATAVALMTNFTPIKPTLLMVLMSFGFIYATLMYVLVLPNLVYAWELALFLFVYAFIAFYFIKEQLSIFFLLGLFVLGIENTMSYEFDLFLMTLLAVYMFLLILMFFYNTPFSLKPEYLFSVYAKEFLQCASAATCHETKLQKLSNKITLWGSKIDTKYFIHVSREEIEAFSMACREFVEKKSSLEVCYNYAGAIRWEHLKESRF